MNIAMAHPSKALFSAFATIRDAVFVETGTYQGNGVAAALNAGFKKVVSIEPVEKFYDVCCKKFKAQIQNGSVVLVHGSSEQKLEAAIANIDAPIVYWLDAHFQGEESIAVHCPIKTGVDIIIRRRIGSSDVLLIDDVRLLTKKSSWGGHEFNAPLEFGRLLLAAPNHAAVLIRGFQPADVFALVPRRLISQFPSLFDREK